MKYFTPELLTRYGSPDDAIADAASVEWEKAAARYTESLRSIKKHMPHGLKNLLRRFSFHDARLSFIGMHGQVLHLCVQPDDPQKNTVFIRYFLAGEIKMTSHAEDFQDHPPYLVW